MSINSVHVVGNLTRDPEVFETANGSKLLKLGIAVNDRIKKGDEWVDVPNFFDCAMFGNRVPFFSERISKGTKVSIEGRLKYEAWEKDGAKHSKVSIIIEDMELMQQSGDSGQKKTTKAESSSVYDEDIPF